MTSALEQAIALFEQSNKFVLTTHVNPDGDGLGSEVALAEWLSSQGKSVSIINYSATPEIYLFLDVHRRILRYDPLPHDPLMAGADVIVVLDTNQPERLRTMQRPVQESAAVKLVIDHHLEPHPFADHYLIDAEATSTGEIMYRLLSRLGHNALSPLVAQNLYCAIMTDTGSFRYPRVDSEIHRIIADLIDRGADPVSIYSNVYERWSNGRIHLLGEMLAGLQTVESGMIAHVSVTQDMLRRTGTAEVDTDNFTIYPMSVEGVLIGILFLELKDGVKVSVRSRGEIPINELAKEFGGNGHLNAAGARLHHVSLEQVRSAVVKAAAKYLSVYSPTSPIRHDTA
ncbi:bifunctional oligoribonuclease/PAP phosphatase NrnA [bacterium]|nr:MAG: bifunctional oligoribonuclease/PAP phosphatase NrnA [bacterium]